MMGSALRPKNAAKEYEIIGAHWVSNAHIFAQLFFSVLLCVEISRPQVVNPDIAGWI